MTDYTQASFTQLASKLPARYRVQTTTYLKALMQALGDGDAYIQTQIDATRDNMLVATASGKYLDRRASLYGIVRDQGAGVQDDDFKKMIPVLGNSKKQVAHALQSIIDVIYGPYASHANTTCSNSAPYALASGKSIQLMVDGQAVEYFFKSTDAIDITNATAQEVANAISDRSSGQVIGSVVTNTRTGAQFVNLRTKTIGSQGFIQVIGGDAQSALLFPQIRTTRQAIANWQVSRYGTSDEMLYTVVSGLSPGMRSAGVKTGDFVTIRHDAGFSLANTGTFQITYSDDTSFRVHNGAGIPEGAVTPIAQAHANDFCFYLPDLGNVLLSSRPATVVQTDPGTLTVILPVTSPIVKRSLVGGHHFHGGVAPAIASTSNTLTLGSVSGFPASGSIVNVASRASSTGVCSSTTPSTITLVDATNWPTSGSAYSPVTQTFYFYSGLSGNALQNVTPAPTSTLAGSTMKYSPRYSYTAISGNTLTGVFPDATPVVGQDVTSGATLSPTFIGAFLYDKTAPFLAANQSAHLAEKVSQGSSRTVVAVDDVSAWPESGYFVLEFGNAEQEGPIRYYGKVGTQALIVDPGHPFTRDHLSGTGIRLVSQVGAYVPKATGIDYPVYLTGTSQARTLVSTFLKDIRAAGVIIQWQIILPGQQWPVLAPLYSQDPIDPTLTVPN